MRVFFLKNRVHNFIFSKLVAVMQPILDRVLVANRVAKRLEQQHWVAILISTAYMAD